MQNKYARMGGENQYLESIAFTRAFDAIYPQRKHRFSFLVRSSRDHRRRINEILAMKTSPNTTTNGPLSCSITIQGESRETEHPGYVRQRRGRKKSSKRKILSFEGSNTVVRTDLFFLFRCFQGYLKVVNVFFKNTMNDIVFLYVYILYCIFTRIFLHYVVIVKTCSTTQDTMTLN